MYRLWALVALSLCSCSSLSPATPATPPANAFATTLSRIERADPNTPAVLTALLSDAETLAGSDDGPCQERLGRAQAELDRVEASTQAHVMFPNGWARTAEVEYAVHLARADCLGDPGRPAELRAAIAAARRAAQLFADSFDYPAVVTMQFNSAALLHQLDDATATAALESTLALDREYGFRADAAENYKLLLTWRGQPADDARVAALMQNFPQRRASLKFAWHPGDAHVTIEDTRVSFWDGVVNHSDAGAAYQRHIVADGSNGWHVSYVQDPGQYAPGIWPTLEASQTPKSAFSPGRLAEPDFKVSATGEFGGTLGADELSAHLIAQADESIRAHAPAGTDKDGLLKQTLDTTSVALSSGLLVAQEAEDFQLETSMWAGATLDQGAWYQLSAPLSLHGLPRIIVQQSLQFAFTRMVPCEAGASEPTCVELVVRTTPDQDAVDRLIKSYGASVATRLVVDPATLLCYSREDRLYWYASIGKTPADSILQSEYRKSTISYAAQ